MANAKADVVIAPATAKSALALFAAKRKNMRVLSAPAPTVDLLACPPGERGMAGAEPRTAWPEVPRNGK